MKTAEETPRESLTWNIYSEDGRHGVLCVYDKESGWLTVHDTLGTSQSRHVGSVATAPEIAQTFAERTFSFKKQSRFLEEVQRLVERYQK